MGGGSTKPALAPCQCKQGYSVMISSNSSAFWDGRGKLRAQKLSSTAERHTASIRSVLTYFGFATVWLLMGAKGGAALTVGTICQLLLRALWLLREGKSQDDPCPCQGTPSQKTKQDECREQEPWSSHHPIIDLQWQWHCSITHTQLVREALVGTGLGEGRYQSSLGFSKIQLLKGSRFKPSG